MPTKIKSWTLYENLTRNKKKKMYYPENTSKKKKEIEHLNAIKTQI